MNLWAYENDVTIHFPRPANPTDKAMIESFKGSPRNDCLNLNWFSSFEAAREKIESLRTEYNELRSHSSFGGTPLNECIEQLRSAQGSQKSTLLAEPDLGQDFIKNIST